MTLSAMQTCFRRDLLVLIIVASTILLLIYKEEYAHLQRSVKTQLLSKTVSYSFKHSSLFKKDSKVSVIPDFLINPSKLCKDEKHIDHILIVHTAVNHFDRRQAIRETFGQRNVSKEFTQRLVFLMGTTSNTTASEQIRNESKQNGDVVQGDFEDSYHNLTLKGLMGLQWVSEHCSNADWVIKIDDDVFVNAFYIKDTVLPNFNTSRRIMGCKVATEAKICRDPGTKWRVEDDEFRGLDIYPFNYCAGFMVILSGDLVPLMLRASRVVPYFWVDDVYLYGMLPETIGDVTILPVETSDDYMWYDDCVRRYGKHCRTAGFLQHSALPLDRTFRRPKYRNYVKMFNKHLLGRIHLLWDLLIS